jgi:uncharacterized protein YjbJ (UPF0337 family)
MSGNQFEGTARTMAGRVEDAVGGLTGDTATQVRGKVRQAAGQAQSAMGDAQNAIGDAAESVRDFAAEQPLGAVLLAAGIGFIAGMLLARR